MRQLKIDKSITNRDYESLSKYFNELNQIDMISPEREIELAKEIKKGNERAVQELVGANLRFVVSVAKQYQNYGVPLIDLIEEGNIGLIKAAQRFDETRGFKFISYAVWWIRQQIQKAIQDNGKIVRLPSNKQGLLMKINRVRDRFQQEFQREPDVTELADELTESEKVIKDTVSSQYGVVFLDQPLTEDSDAKKADFVLFENDSETEKSLFKGSIRGEAERLLSKLPKMEKFVLRHIYGLGGEKKLSTSQLAQQLGLSKERIRQVKHRAIRRLRSQRIEHMRDYLA